MAKDKAPSKADKAEAEGDAEGEGGAAAPRKKRGLVGKLIVFGLPALALLAVLGGVYFFFLAGGDEPAEGEHGAKIAEGPPPVFFDLPEMLVNLAAPGGERAMLKLVVALELSNAEMQAAIEPILPRVIDNFQVFLRELRIEDLSGSAGMFRLKEELVRRVNLAVAPSEVRDVLFKEMLIQ